MRKLILVLVVSFFTCFVFAVDEDTVNITLEVAPKGPICFFSDSPITSVEAEEPNYPTEILERNTADDGGAKGEIYAAIITNQHVAVSISWNDLESSSPSVDTVLPLSVSSTSCTVTKASSPAESTPVKTSNTEVVPATEDTGSEHSLDLNEPEGTASGTRVICHKIDLSISEASYLAANAADDYSTTMYLSVSAV